MLRRRPLLLAAFGPLLVLTAGARPPATPQRRVAITVGVRPGTTIARGLFGANLLWPYSAGGAFDAAARRWYPQFVQMVRGEHITALRYPGGTTADSFHWQRAIGAPAQRRDNEPFGMQTAALLGHAVLDGPVPSTVGPDEFGRLLQRTGSSGTVVVNFATGTVQEAADFVAYLTAHAPRRTPRDHAAPGYWAARRARNGHRAPYDISYVEVGNEQLAPAEYGWRSGALVALGPHTGTCAPRQVAVCLYAFGGTTRFSDQPVGRFANAMPGASRSNGRPGQSFYVDYPPVVPHSLSVDVGGQRWAPTSALAAAPRGAHVYQFRAQTGEITFGDSTHGAIPRRGAEITVSYASGPHGGFTDFYRAIKAVDPRVRVCETVAPSVYFLKLMGRTHPYDCAEVHPYAVPKDVSAPLARYQASLMGFPPREGASLAHYQSELRHYAGRRVPVVITEYGQLVAPMPKGYPRFILSLDESLLIAAQLRQWIDHRVPLAEKYLLTSSPFLGRDPRGLTVESVLHVTEKEKVAEWDPGLSIDSAMIAGPGPRFVAEPTGEVIALLSRLAGGKLLHSSITNGPRLPGATSEPVLLTTAALVRGHRELVVVNTSLRTAVRSELRFAGGRHGARIAVSVLDGPSATAYNTAAHPTRVRITSRHVTVGSGAFAWTFPAHSVTLLRL